MGSVHQNINNEPMTFVIENRYNKDINYLKKYTEELFQNGSEELCGGGMDFFIDDPEFKTSGWKYWAGLVINNITNLDKEIKSLKDELKTNTDNLYTEIRMDKNNISEIKVNLEELKRISDKLGDLRDDIKDMKGCYENMNKDVTSLKIKSSMWGALSGAVSAGIAAIIYMLIKK